MASSAAARPWGQRLLPNEFLAAASALFVLAALVAITRGRQDWGQVPPLIWLHLTSILTATMLTPVMLVRRKGDGRHRVLGHVWTAAMMVAAGSSLFFSTSRPQGWGVFSGNFSVIHLLSVFVLVQVPRLVMCAWQHDRAGHERSVRAMVTGALLIAGFFTFPFNRLLGHWWFG